MLRLKDADLYQCMQCDSACLNLMNDDYFWSLRMKNIIPQISKLKNIAYNYASYIHLRFLCNVDTMYILRFYDFMSMLFEVEDEDKSQFLVDNYNLTVLFDIRFDILLFCHEILHIYILPGLLMQEYQDLNYFKWIENHTTKTKLVFDERYQRSVEICKNYTLIEYLINHYNYPININNEKLLIYLFQTPNKLTYFHTLAGNNLFHDKILSNDNIMFTILNIKRPERYVDITDQDVLEIFYFIINNAINDQQSVKSCLSITDYIKKSDILNFLINIHENKYLNIQDDEERYVKHMQYMFYILTSRFAPSYYLPVIKWLYKTFELPGKEEDLLFLKPGHPLHEGDYLLLQFLIEETSIVITSYTIDKIVDKINYMNHETDLKFVAYLLNRPIQYGGPILPSENSIKRLQTLQDLKKANIRFR